jgi:DNA-directed RNA polymerase subunit beta'
MRTTAGQLLINSVIPEDIRDYDRVLDKKGSQQLFQLIAEKYPDKYREISKSLMDVARRVAHVSGGYSVGVDDLQSSVAAKRMRLTLDSKLKQIYADKTLNESQRNKKIITVAGELQKRLIDEVFDEAKANNNPLALQAISGAKGNKFNVNSLLGADLLYTDHRGNVVPIPVRHSYAQGLTPAEFFAGAFGARKGLVDLKLSTSDAGYFSKQLSQAAHRLLVSAKDNDQPYDEAMPRGLPVDTDEPDNAGALLAHPAGGFPRNTVLTPKILKTLKAAGHDQILVRSPLVGGPADGGVYAYDVGQREKGRIAPVGDFVGTAAAQSVGEQVAQSAISSKHTGGIVGASSKAIGGFKLLDAMVQGPEHFPGVASHAQLDGKVTTIREAPQGGNYVTIGTEEHYVPGDQSLLVKPGQMIEAGDRLSSGIPHPEAAVKFKGLGEGRRYWLKSFFDSLKDSNVDVDRRNVELVARGLLNHVRLTDEVGDYSPDDVVPYQALEAIWQPRKGFKRVPIKQAVGKYLERPVLHHTLGTQIRPSLLSEMERYGVKEVDVHDDPPPFAPEFVRGMANAAQDPDWMTRFYGGYQQNSLLEAARRGAVSDEESTSFVPALARGENFGRLPWTQGWQPQS